MNKKLPVAFLWHMHQPLYKDLVTGKYHLPWVRLHSTYSYLDMVSIIEKYPEAKATFNITPVLMWQLLDISGDKPVDDTYLALSEKPAKELMDDDKCFILKNFFSCDYQKAVLPIRKYNELFHRRGEDFSKPALKKKLSEFSTADFRDLQVFFNLAWCGFTLRHEDQSIKYLLKKAKGFTEEDKASLLAKQHEVVKSILPYYKRLQDSGRIEVSTTPFYHPIMPLLSKGESGQGYNFKEDAKVHIERAVQLYENVFGRKPAGMWPSEGSVSQEVIPLFADAGIKWIATDEGILYKSLNEKDKPRDELIYKAYTAEAEGRQIDMVFRDINISNAISFTYSSMSSKKAFSDLYRDISGIHHAVKGKDGDFIIPIILDGENPWPYFNDGGRAFLSETYQRLSTSKDVELVTIGGYLDKYDDRGKISNLYSGSWINRNFDKWIGSPQKNKAWEYLEKTREDAFIDGKPSKEVLEELYIAQGSDWFWWYDDFGTELNFVFDDLYRMHLANVYKLQNKKVPHYLTRPIHSGPSAKRLSSTLTPDTMGRFPKVLLVSSEIFPFAKTGGLADVSGSLPKALTSFGCDVRSIMPLYKGIEGKFDLDIEKKGIDPDLQKGTTGFDLYSNRQAGVTTYFVKNDKLFKRDGLYGDDKGDFPDNGVRFAYFSSAVLKAAEAIDFKPDIVHCNDWQSALVPFYLRFSLKDDDFYKGIKILFTIHNMAYQGNFNRSLMEKISMPGKFFNMDNLEFYGKLCYMKSGILYSDSVNTVSHKYAEEIMTPQFGCGLDGLLREKKNILYGIPNGVDYSSWSPNHDKYLKAKYDKDTLDSKLECKKDLLGYTGLTIGLNSPLIGVVSRFADQKGIDIFAEAVGKIVDFGAGLVVLGEGNKYYNRLMLRLKKKYPGKVFVEIGFNEELAHKIEAGSDMFVMASRYEPCGLNQMYSIKYGTIPIVRATGGLDDVIIDYNENIEEANGFKFGSVSEDALVDAVERAVNLYNNDKEAWTQLMIRAMSCDFSWEVSAKKYLHLYRILMGEGGE